MDGIMRGRHAEEYEKRQKKGNEERQNTFLKRVVAPNKVIADFCCGTGVSIEFVLHKAKRIYGIEASSDMLNICKEKFCKNKKVKLILCDVNKTPLKDKCADYVIIRLGLHHIKNKRAVIAEACRILKVEGSMIIMDNFAVSPKIITSAYDFVRRAIKNNLGIRHYFATLKEFEMLVNGIFKVSYLHQQRKNFIVRANMVLKKIDWEKN